MAFSIRKMLSNITYFSKPGEEANQKQNDLLLEKGGQTTYVSDERSSNIDFERTEPDSTSRCANSLKLPESVKTFAAKKGSFSDTDLLAIDAGVKDKRKKKLKLDIKKASQSLNENMNNVEDDSSNVENTPKHVSLDCRSADVFSERFKKFNFNQSFDISDASSESSYEEEDINIESLSDQSDTEASASSAEEKPVKMCRKVELQHDNQLVPSATPESFGDVELDKNEEERITLLLKYQMKLEKIACVFKKLLTEFEFHIEVSKIFNCKSIVTALPGTDVSNIPKMLGDVTYMDNINRGISPAGSWNIVMEKEDTATKHKLKTQLLCMKQAIESFVNVHLENGEKKKLTSLSRSLTFEMHKGKRHHKQGHISYKKKMKHFDFPDLREAMINLFSESDHNLSDITKLHDLNDSDTKCMCSCHCSSPPTETDSGLTTKTDNTSDQSITSSIGNFSLDSSTLSAYSESLDLIVSYNSFQDTSLYSMMLQKAAIERITFYVQVHSIQLKCEAMDKDFELKNTILFHCPSCNITENEENGLLKHILSQFHCEKIHFQYKTAYIKKCMSSGKEIQPSSVLNPMTMYRDENKIVCFGDAMYACSLCFENLIIGESILMAHCSNEEHLDKKEKFFEILE